MRYAIWQNNVVVKDNDSGIIGLNACWGAVGLPKSIWGGIYIFSDQPPSKSCKLTFLNVRSMASGKKHSGHEAYASSTVTDPRQNKGANHETWCDLDPQCNGWTLWLQEVSDGKLKN